MSLPVVSMHGITKRFGALMANAGIDLGLYPGEVHALLGENGAGKSTLMKILYGLYHPDAGEILMDGQPVTLGSPMDAIAHGIGMVAQHFSLVRTFSVAENVVLGLPTGFRYDYRAAEKAVDATAKRFGIAISPSTLVRHLSVGEQQKVEILKALHRHARVLILDEPTAVLTPQESRSLFASIQGLVGQGLAVVFISHKLEEVFAVSQRVTVLRDGHVVGRLRTDEATPTQLARLMVGRESFGVTRAAESDGRSNGPPVLEVSDLRARSRRGHEPLKGITLRVNAGEILAVAGVAGNGQSELAQVLSGMLPPSGGQLRFKGQALAGKTPSELRRAGIGIIPEDRLAAVVPDLSVAENAALEHLGDFSRLARLDQEAMRRHAAELIAEYQIKARPEDRARSLSGGNIQKLILARSLHRNPALVLAVDPTRGLDIGATDYVRRRLLEQRARGAAVLLISEDLDEILALADRVAVIYEGRIVGEIPAEKASAETLGLMMSGSRSLLWSV